MPSQRTAGWVSRLGIGYTVRLWHSQREILLEQRMRRKQLSCFHPSQIGLGRDVRNDFQCAHDAIVRGFQNLERFVPKQWVKMLSGAEEGYGRCKHGKI